MDESEADKIKWNKVGEFLVVNGKKFYSPYQCFCCGKIISKEQFCWSALCGYCDIGRCGGCEEGHGRKDIFKDAEDMGDELQEIIKEKIKNIKIKKI